MTTNKERKEFEKWANERLKHYAKVMLMDSYDLLPIAYDEKVTFLQSTTRYPYRSVYIEYGPKALKEWAEDDKQYVERGLIHELMHGILDPMQYMLRRNKRPSKDEERCATEQVVDHLSLMVWKNERTSKVR